MANNFERAVVTCFNRYFTEHGMRAFAYRLKQAHFNTQYVDIIVDSLDPSYYLAIECKSVKGKSLYFTSNFHKDKDNVHQIDNITGFLEYTGRRGFLAMEFRCGQKNEAYLMPWERVLAFFASQASIPIDEFRKCILLDARSSRGSKCIPLKRTRGGYQLLSPL